MLILWIWALIMTGLVLYLLVRPYTGKSVGTIVITNTGDGKLFSLEIDGDPDDIADHNFVSFRVQVDSDQ